MSFLGIGGASSPTQSPMQQGGGYSQNIEVAIAELDMVTDIFNRIVSSCHTKCISPRYAEADLNKGESVCVDRCVAKFFEVNKRVGEKMQAVGAAQGGGGGPSPGGFGGL